MTTVPSRSCATSSSSATRAMIARPRPPLSPRGARHEPLSAMIATMTSPSSRSVNLRSPPAGPYVVLDGVGTGFADAEQDVVRRVGGGGDVAEPPSHRGIGSG